MEPEPADAVDVLALPKTPATSLFIFVGYSFGFPSGLKVVEQTPSAVADSRGTVSTNFVHGCPCLCTNCTNTISCSIILASVETSESKEKKLSYFSHGFFHISNAGNKPATHLLTGHTSHYGTYSPPLHLSFLGGHRGCQIF